MGFVDKTVRMGVLPRFLQEVLETRILIKNSIKEEKKRSSPDLGRIDVLDSRQFSLKMIANVTCGFVFLF